jgi:signal peptidase I
LGTGTTYHRRRIGRFALLAAGITALAVWRARPFRAVVRGSSMEPKLRDGDTVVAFAGRTPRTGDVVVIEHPMRPGFDLVKRVAGSPGEVVHLPTDGSRVMGPVELGPGEWFVTGDAPGASTDSRSFGPVSSSRLRGVVVWPRVGRKRPPNGG